MSSRNFPASTARAHSIVPVALGLFDWLGEHEALAAWVGIGSIVLFVATLVAAPIVLARLPADHFASEEQPPSPFAEHHPVLRVTLTVLRNLVGAFLVLMGIALLALPGQGVLTLLLGFLVLDFKGKRRIELALLRRRRVLRTINWIRRRAGREPLQVAGARSEDPARGRSRSGENPADR